jgi:hypothetical protein
MEQLTLATECVIKHAQREGSSLQENRYDEKHKTQYTKQYIKQYTKQYIITFVYNAINHAGVIYKAMT